MPLMVLLYDNWGYERQFWHRVLLRDAVETNADMICQVERIEAIELPSFASHERAGHAWHWWQFCASVSHFRASRSPIHLGSPMLHDEERAMLCRHGTLFSFHVKNNNDKIEILSWQRFESRSASIICGPKQNCFDSMRESSFLSLSR